MVTDYEQKYFDAIEECNRLKEECKLLRKENKQQINTFTSEIRQLKNKLSKYEKKETIKNTQMHDFIQKFLFSRTFLSVITEYTTNEYGHTINPIIVGSFVRQMFEILFINGEYTKDSKLYGKPNSRDIDIILTKTQDYRFEYESILELMNNIMAEKKLINGYRLLSIKNLTLKSDYNIVAEGKKKMENIPHYKLVFFNDQEKKKIDIDLLGWKPKDTKSWSENDYDINSLSIDTNGIHFISKKKFNFIDIINNIYKRTAICQINLGYINELANVTKFGTMPQFRGCISQILYFLAERTKILKDNITIQMNSKFPIYRIEDTEPCCDTKVSAPYPVLLLECGDWITLPHLAKLLINYKNNYKCTKCERNLGLKFDDIQNLEPCDEFISQSARAFIRSSITNQLFLVKNDKLCDKSEPQKPYKNHHNKSNSTQSKLDVPCKLCGKHHNLNFMYAKKNLYPYPS